MGLPEAELMVGADSLASQLDLAVSHCVLCFRVSVRMPTNSLSEILCTSALPAVCPLREIIR